jgi:hypothetical protein
MRYQTTRLFLLLAALAALLVPAAAHAQGPTPVATGRLCLAAFDDANANGARDADEGPVAGVAFTVRDATHLAVAYTTGDQSEPTCYDLLPGDYRIVALAPAGRGATGDQSWEVTLAGNQLVTAEFASRAGAPLDAPADMGVLLYQWSGAGLLVLAVVMLIMALTRRGK